MGFFDVTFWGTHYLLKRVVQVVIALLIALLLISFKAPMRSKTYVYSIFREFVKAQMMWKTRAWHELDGKHFVVRYQNPDQKMAPMVLETAEKAYVPVQRDFAYSPKGKALIIIYPTRESLSKSFGWDSDESAMGVYWAGVIRVLSPKVWIDTTNYDEMKDVFEVKGPMAHEYTHLMVDYITKGNYTRWFTEGIALNQEFKLNGSVDEEYRQSLNGKQLYPLDTMDKEFDSLSDQTLAYRESYEAVHYLIEKHDEQKLWEILARLSYGETMNQSFQDALGYDLNGFQNELFHSISLESR